MKWIVLAILACIVPYTWVNLAYRKPGPSYLPYQDNKSRAEVLRLLDAGFRRVDLAVERPAHLAPPAPLAAPAVVTTQPGGLPPLLSEVLLEKPLVPAAITEVTAPRAAPADRPYVVVFTCSQPNDRERVAGATLYLREREATLVTAFEPVEGELLTRSRTTTAQVEVPAGTFSPGTYRVTVVGARESRAWSVEVR